MPPFDALLRLTLDNTSQQSKYEEFVLVRVIAKFGEPRIRYNMMKAVNFGDKDLDLIPKDTGDDGQIMVYAIPSLQNKPAVVTEYAPPEETEYKSAESRDGSEEEKKAVSQNNNNNNKKRGIAIRKLQMRFAYEND